MATGQSQITNQTEFSEELPFPVPYSFLSNLSDNVKMLYTSAKFYRTATNTNLQIIIPIGNNFAPTIWYSLDTTLPSETFNSTNPITEITFPNNNSVQINRKMTFYHSAQIDFKLGKNITSDGYQNFRKIQCILARPNGVPYESVILHYKQPGPNSRDTLSIQGSIDHEVGDIIILQFNIMQDDTNSDQSDTLMTIYNITWNMMGLKVLP